jgi:hypothetical protein
MLLDRPVRDAGGRRSVDGLLGQGVALWVRQGMGLVESEVDMALLPPIGFHPFSDFGAGL